MNPLQQQELINKLQTQNEKAGYDTTASIIPPIQQSVQKPIQPVEQIIGQPSPKPSPQPGQLADNILVNQSDSQTIDPPIDQPDTQSVGEVIQEAVDQITPQPISNSIEKISQENIESVRSKYSIDDTNDTSVEKMSRKERIQFLEQALEEDSPKMNIKTDQSIKARTYLDDFGEETYYVKNISNGHVAVSDIDITVPRGSCVDLLKFAELQDIKKSRDLRSVIGYNDGKKMYKNNLLLRLTPEQYEEEKIKELKNKQKIEQFKQAQAVSHARQEQQMNSQQMQQTQGLNNFNNLNPNQPQTPTIKPNVLSNLEKLRLSNIPESMHLGISPEEFVEWAVTENLILEELDFIISHPNVINNPEIRTALYERRSEIA